MRELPRVVSVSAGRAHGPEKPVRAKVELLKDLGVAGDAHAGRTVQHRSRARRHPDWVNLRQVHLLGVELHEELRAHGLPVGPGDMGENVLTAGLDLLDLPLGTLLTLGADAVVELTGLRNPCTQLDGVRQGLMAAVLDRTEDGSLVLRCGVMGIVRAGGAVVPGDPVAIDLPTGEHRQLAPV